MDAEAAVLLDLLPAPGAFQGLQGSTAVFTKIRIRIVCLPALVAFHGMSPYVGMDDLIRSL